MGDVEVVIFLAVILVIIIIVFCYLPDGGQTVQQFNGSEIYLESTSFTRYPTLDLHGNSVSSAIDKLNQRLNYGGPITVITGQGHHSYGGIDKIRRAVIDYLDDRLYTYSYTIDDLNPGRIHIHRRY
ncbi:NEDD4-binding protein 2-like isoform X2 [Haliotis rufescens]|nr:NEDD4-binding protein 2-like isoform X2 [Haliotis rufescens]XP_048243452.1 NEDD4-binding protein 2-like isoform X2 [Haliotis rufescens]